MTGVFRCALAGAAAALIFGGAATAASAQTGGAVAPGGTSTAPAAGAPAGVKTVKGNRAKVNKKGMALAPRNAPAAVHAAIAAGNRIRKKPYVWGGGHADFEAKGYDCSGAVSYVLNAAGMLESPLSSGPLMKWGLPGKGTWITVYSNPGHVYAVIAGLRWDTSSMGSGGNGPRWRPVKRSAKGFAVRHYDGY